MSEALKAASLPQIQKSIEEYCHSAAMRLRSFNPEERQRFLRVLVRTIIFDGATARIKGIIPIVRNVSEPRISDDSSRSGIGTTTSECCGRNSGGIEDTTIEGYGRNPSQIFNADEGGNPSETHVAFELVQSVPRLPRSRIGSPHQKLAA